MAFQFTGFSTPNGTIVPDEVFDVLAPELSEAELRVLLYIIRRTFGFKKNADDISLKQMTDGIKKKDGTILDRGTGMSKSANWRGVKGLIAKKVIASRHNSSPERGDLPTTYSLRFKSGGDGSGEEEPNNQEGDQSQRIDQGQRAVAAKTCAEMPQVTDQVQVEPGTNTPQFSKRTPPSSPKEHPRVLFQNTQETVWQQTVLQQTDFKHSNIRKQHTAKIKKPETPSQEIKASTEAVMKQTAFEPISSVLLRTQPQQITRSEAPEEARDAIRAYLEDIASQFNDQAPLESSVSRAYNLYENTNLPLGEFLSQLLGVSSLVRERRLKVKNRAYGSKVIMPYYFACLEDRLGLRQQSRGVSNAQAPAKPPGLLAQAGQDGSAHFSPRRTSSPSGEQGGKYPPPHTHSFAHPSARLRFTQSGQLSVDARSASAAPP